MPGQDTHGSDPLSQMFAGFADPARRAILSRLAVETLTPDDLAAGLGLAPETVRAHLALLEGAGLIAPLPQPGGDRLHLRSDRIVMVETWLSWFRRFRIEHHDRLQSCIDGDAPRGPRRPDRQA